jgi:MFS family permease
MLGTQIAPVGLVFAILQLTGSKSDVGYVLAARFAPQLVFLLIGGVVADRLPRHKVMVASDVISGATQAAIAALLLAGYAKLWHLIVLAAISGGASAFFGPASAGIVPQTVPAEELQRANTLLRLGMNAVTVIGPALGGIIVAATNPGWALAANAASFGGSAFFVARLRAVPREAMQAPNLVRELALGWREFVSRRWLWVIVVQFALVNAAFAGTLSVLGPIQAERHLGGAAAFGTVLSCLAAGFVLGGLTNLRFHPDRLLLAATLAVFPTVLPLVLLGFPAPLAVIAASAVVAGLGIETFGVLWDTSLQQHVPLDALSRVASYDQLGSLALTPIGFAVMGPIADGAGIRPAIWGAAALIVVATLPVLLVRDVRELHRVPATVAEGRT